METNPLPLDPGEPPAPFVPLGDGALLPAKFRTRLTGDDLPGVESIDVTIVVRDSTQVCTELTIRSTETGALTSEILRSITLGVLVPKLAAERLYAEDLPPDNWLTNAPPGQKIMMPLASASEEVQAAAVGRVSQRRRRVTHEFLEQVADVYRAAIDTGAPTQAVADTFRVSHSTAARYVNKARKSPHNLLGETLPGRPGEIDDEGNQS
jgi:hypothetical protein